METYPRQPDNWTVQLCRQLGLEPSAVHSLSIHAQAGEPTRIDVTIWPVGIGMTGTAVEQRIAEGLRTLTFVEQSERDA